VLSVDPAFWIMNLIGPLPSPHSTCISAELESPLIGANNLVLKITASKYKNSYGIPLLLGRNGHLMHFCILNHPLNQGDCIS